MVRYAEALLVVALVWGAFAFGAVYPWAYGPLVAATLAVGLIGLAVRARDRRIPHGLIALAASFAVFLAAGLLQLVPVPLGLLFSVSPESTYVIPRLDFAVAAGAAGRHPLSIAPVLTQVGLVLFAANALLVLGGARLFSMRGARRVAVALTVVGVALALAGLVQSRFPGGDIYGFWKPLSGGSPFGPFVNRNHFAGWMLMALPVTLGLLCGGIAQAMSGVRPDWRARVLWCSSPGASRLVLLAAGAIVMALSLVMTMSRLGMAALALALLVTGGCIARRQRSGHRAAAMAYLVLLIVVVVSWTGAEAIGSRFGEANWGDLNDRRGAWDDAIGIAAKFPLTGTGLNTYGVATLFYQQHDLARHYAQAHNDYLQLAAEGGLLLTVPFAMSAGFLIIAVRRRFLEEGATGANWLRIGAVTGLVAIAFQETVEFSLQMPGNALLFAVLCAIALHRAPDVDKPHRLAPALEQPGRQATASGALGPRSIGRPVIRISDRRGSVSGSNRAEVS